LNQDHKRARFQDTNVGMAIRRLAGAGTKFTHLPPYGVVWDANTGEWKGGKAIQDWREKLRKSNKPSGTEGEPFPSNPVTHSVHRDKPLHLGKRNLRCLPIRRGGTAV
jgi:hypothetical protein